MRHYLDLLTLKRNGPANIRDARRPPDLASALPIAQPSAHPVSLRHATRRYLAAFAATLVLVGALVFGVNAAIDPFWYVGGNKLFPRNFAYNERLQKTNLLLAVGPASYDCLVLGNSRTLLLDARRVGGHRCFNYSFSAGSLNDFVAFARYAKHHGMAPRLVIVSVDAENFAERAIGERIIWNEPVPDFISALAPPPSIWHSYLTWDALVFSLRTVFSARPTRRYYDREFIAHVLPEVRAYQRIRHFINDAVGRNHNARGVAQYRILRGIFPDARLIGFVQPVSADIIARRRDAGSLEGALDAIYAVRDTLDALHDFSVPSGITSERRNQLDDGHFSRETYDRIVDTLNGESAAFGIDLAILSRAQYSQAYAEGLARFGRAAAATPTP